MDGLHPSSYFQVLQSLYQSFDDCTKCTNYNWYKRHFHVPQFLQFPSKVEVLIFLFTFFQFYSVVNRNSLVHIFASSLFLLLIIVRSGRLAEIKWSVCMSKSLRSLRFILQERCWVVHIPFVRTVKFKFLAQFPVDHLAHTVVSSLIHFYIYYYY